MREETARLTRKLRTAEAELDTKRSQAQRQAANTEKLQEQLKEITAGTREECVSSGSSAGSAAYCVVIRLYTRAVML